MNRESALIGKKFVKCQMLYEELNLLKEQQRQIVKMLEAMEKVGGEIDNSTWSSSRERNLILQGMNLFAVGIIKSL